ITVDELRSLKFKKLGADRLVLGVLPVALARDTRFYWKPDWKPGNPSFLGSSAPGDASQSIVNSWDGKWKEIIGGYMKGMVDLGADGVVLDQIEGYRYFEERMPLE